MQYLGQKRFFWGKSSMCVLILMGETSIESWCILVTSNLDVNKINASYGTTFTEIRFGESQQSWSDDAEHIYSLHFDTVKE
jgi:hypothetical protein